MANDIKHLEILTKAGTPEPQAKAVLSILGEVKSGLATKEDLKNLEKSIELKMEAKDSQLYAKISDKISSQTVSLMLIIVAGLVLPTILKLITPSKEKKEKI